MWREYIKKTGCVSNEVYSRKRFVYVFLKPSYFISIKNRKSWKIVISDKWAKTKYISLRAL